MIDWIWLNYRTWKSVAFIGCRILVVWQRGPYAFEVLPLSISQSFEFRLFRCAGNRSVLCRNEFWKLVVDRFAQQDFVLEAKTFLAKFPIGWGRGWTRLEWKHFRFSIPDLTERFVQNDASHWLQPRIITIYASILYKHHSFRPICILGFLYCLSIGDFALTIRQRNAIIRCAHDIVLRFTSEHFVPNSVKNKTTLLTFRLRK